MTRSLKSAKNAGTALETMMAEYFREWVDDRVYRQTRTGAKDRGDIGGVFAFGERVVVECKDYGGRLLPASWVAEAEVERGNADAVAAVVIAKRKGTRDPGDQWVLCTVRDLVALLGSERPE